MRRARCRSTMPATSRWSAASSVVSIAPRGRAGHARRARARRSAGRGRRAPCARCASARGAPSRSPRRRGGPATRMRSSTHCCRRRAAASMTIRVERARPLGQAGQEGGLGRGEVLRRGVEVGAAGRLRALELVPVGRDVQVQGQDLALGEPVLDAQGEQRFAQLARRGAVAVDEHLDRLLGQRRSAFDHPARADVVPEGAHQGEGIDPRDDGRSARPPRPGWRARARRAAGRRSMRAAALAFGGQRLAQGLAVAGDDLGRGVLVQGEETRRAAGRSRTQASAEGRGQGDRRPRGAAAASRLHRDHGGAACGRRLPARTSPRRAWARCGRCPRWWPARRR